MDWNISNLNRKKKEGLMKVGWDFSGEQKEKGEKSEKKKYLKL